MAKYLIAIFAVIILLGAGLYYFLDPLKTKRGVVITEQANNITLSPTTEPPSPTPTSIPKSANTKTYSSEKLGIKFDYLEKQNDQTIAVKEIENKIYVYISTTPYTNGQYVEVFQKAKTDTLAQAIEKKFLAGFPAKDCFVTMKTAGGSLKHPSNFEMTVISFAKDNNPQAENPWANAEKCPPVYTETNGMAYFLMDKNHPDKFMFLSIGQYGIFAQEPTPPNNAIAWQDTLEVIN